MDIDSAIPNLAVNIEKPRSAHWWAAYCIDHHSYKADNRLGSGKSPELATRKLTQQAKVFYEGIGIWLNVCPEMSFCKSR